jgi:hypothetical protein
MAGFCRWSGKRCYRSSCDIFDCKSGNVLVCPHHFDPAGRFMRRIFRPMFSSVINKHFTNLWVCGLRSIVSLFVNSFVSLRLSSFVRMCIGWVCVCGRMGAFY